MFSLLRYFRQRAAIRQYAQHLGPALRKAHGRRRHYSTKQVRQCAASGNLDLSFICFAYSMYCSRAEFDRHHAEAGQSCDYDAMRGEVGQQCFHGAAAFAATDVPDASGHAETYDHSVGHDGGCHDGEYDVGAHTE